MSDPFISTTDLETFMDNDPINDDLATIAVDSACQAIRSYLNRPLNLTTETKKFNGSGTDALLVQAPLVNVDTVSIDDVELVEVDDYLLGDGILYRVGSCWPRGRLNVEVTYTHGYAIEEADVGADSGDVGEIERMPSDIREVALELAKAAYTSGPGASGALSSETIGPDSYSYTVDTSVAGGAALTEDHRKRLLPYRFKAVA